MIIAIDGYSSCGKSTIARDLAMHLQYVYIDTGAMYRAVTYFCLQNSIIKQGVIDEQKLKSSIDSIHIEFKLNSQAVQETFLNNVCVEKEIRGLEVSEHVSMVSKLAFVRHKLVQAQREYGVSGNIVMDGRDIGTAVFPHADYKFFITASVQVRAQRRYDELIAKGEDVDFNAIVENIVSRDLHDTNRKESPLIQAPDAIVLDTSLMNKKEQLDWILNHIKIK